MGQNLQKWQIVRILPAALKCATWYQNTNMNTFAQNGAPSFFNPFSESNDLLRKLLAMA